ncbi:MAG: glycosyltransferase family 4 protein [Elusimicrobia bacterium]|nr:glycosyltransferase family 4 protein [Elusimicrobiota bacterium]
MPTPKTHPPAPVTSKIRVLHIITKLEFGGAQQNTLYTVGHLDPNRFEIHLACGRGGYLDKTIPDLPRHVNVHWLGWMRREIRPWFDFPALIELWLVTMRIRPRVTHTHSSKAGILGRLAAWLSGAPVIIHTYHGFGFHDRLPKAAFIFLSWLERWVAAITTQLVYVSESNKAYGDHWGVHGRNPPVLIRSGVQLNRLQPWDEGKRRNKRSQLSLRPDDLVVTTVGNLKPQKNPEHFWELAKRMIDLPQLKFLFIGGWEGPSPRGELFRHVPTNLIYLGWREDAVDILKVSDIFVMTSLWEGLPRSAVEAMTIGLPVIAYQTDGLVEIVKNNVNGHLSPSGNLDDLERVLRDLAADQSKRRNWGRQAALAITEEFDIDYMIRQQENLYQRLM